MSRGNAKQCIFEDDRDHVIFLELLARLLVKYSIACLAYCLFWNHFHLLVVPTEHTVSRLMQDLNSTYCRGFNRRHGRRDHVLGERFKGPMVDDHSYLLMALRYIALNPVEGGRVTVPGDWRWSSYRATAGLEPCPSFLSLDPVWSALDTDDAAAGRERYITFVDADCPRDGYRELASSLYIGGRELGRKVDPLLEPHRRNAAFTYAQRYATRPPLAEILDVPDDRPAQQEAARIAFCQHAYKLAAIGEFLGRPASTIWYWIKVAKERHARATQPSADSSAKPRTPSTRRGQSSIFE